MRSSPIRQQPPWRAVPILLAALGSAAFTPFASAKPAPAPQSAEDIGIKEIIDKNRPSTLGKLPEDFNARHGATHSDGKYHFTDKPFLVEGARRILGLGARLGKFWFAIDAAKKFYSFNSDWPACKNLPDLANTPYFQEVWDMPFQTILLTTTAPSEEGWRKPEQKPEFWAKISRDYYDIAAFFYEKFRDRPVTVILQNWEGDWMLRGIGKPWDPPPDDWRLRCESMQRWIAAKQEGINRARRDFAGKSRCTVAHAVEVNRVADAWKGIPTVTRNVLPGVEVDLVSYSAYDGINQGDPVRFWKCIDEIRDHIRTGPLFGPGAIMIGEYGIPENDAPERIRERYDEMLGVMLAKNILYSAQWELYCNELAGKKEDLQKSPPEIPVKDAKAVRGFFLVKPDGSLSEGGKFFSELWSRASGVAAAGDQPGQASAVH
jgi:hypothetical protein